MTIQDVIFFNPLKHHLGYIRECMLHFNDTVPSLVSHLKTIGGSQMDLYTGDLSVVEVYHQIRERLLDIDLLKKSLYFKYLDQNNGYIILKLTDDSLWVLRKGVHPQKFVHIHPARYSPHSMRIKASTLKTVIAARIACGKEVGLAEINEIRVKNLHLSPLKKMISNRGIGKMLQLL